MTVHEIVSTWKGRPIEDLSKDELVEVVNYLANHNRQMRELHDIERDLWRSAPRRISAASLFA